MSRNVEKIKYIKTHRKAIRKLEKHLSKKRFNSLSIIFHDLDKLILLNLCISPKTITKIHRFYSRHHTGSFWRKKDLFSMFLDFESARFTKPDKPLIAIQTAERYKKDYLKDMVYFTNKYKEELSTFEFNLP